MDQLFIPETKRTPEVSFEPNGNLIIKGRSIPEDPSKFFEPLYKWLCDYSESPKNITNFNVVLEYFNSGSAKSLLSLLKTVATLRQNPQAEVIVNWHYETGDDDILERGQYYSSILNMDFNFIEILTAS